ncbi:MAG: preprotein translocase subunit SecE [Rhodothermaceae bacterium]|nr:preprotein translocase subunit SecE [Rhodothermaceae bacterium]MXZ04251.1 preprotein translocase subunit SecE [Rhodothermaceae bacterium]MYD18312.1 preprotein translocase subunit SecE [Rhodothermaceae bacterium]MYD55853.1 preprotein translocase subunit SecE [Rhodothermaceae bacterium]MYJ56112.1 preprotein translocase subunit SecE [Rhodothermaceae bacterium]
MRNLVNNTRTYLEEVAVEMRKASWPQRRELINNTVITLVASFVLAIFIFGADRLISRILEFIYPG